MDLNTWAKNLTREVYQEWQIKYPTWKPGIKVFYSPVHKDPELMIISYQPGGDESHYKKEDRVNYEKGDFSIKQNEFVATDYPMAKRVRDFFNYSESQELLNKSVILPLIFFRAPDVKNWKNKIINPSRKKMEAYCYNKVTEIIKRIKPNKILVIGINTYFELKQKVLDDITNEMILHTRPNTNERMVISSECEEIKLFAIAHLTGVRISKNDWNIMKAEFHKWVNK